MKEGKIKESSRKDYRPENYAYFVAPRVNT